MKLSFENEKQDLLATVSITLESASYPSTRGQSYQIQSKRLIARMRLLRARLYFATTLYVLYYVLLNPYVYNELST